MAPTRSPTLTRAPLRRTHSFRRRPLRRRCRGCAVCRPCRRPGPRKVTRGGLTEKRSPSRTSRSQSLSAAADIENVSGSQAADTLRGNSLANTFDRQRRGGLDLWPGRQRHDQRPRRARRQPHLLRRDERRHRHRHRRHERPGRLRLRDGQPGVGVAALPPPTASGHPTAASGTNLLQACELATATSVGCAPQVAAGAAPCNRGQLRKRPP